MSFFIGSIDRLVYCLSKTKSAIAWLFLLSSIKGDLPMMRWRTTSALSIWAVCREIQGRSLEKQTTMHVIRDIQLAISRSSTNAIHVLLSTILISTYNCTLAPTYSASPLYLLIYLVQISLDVYVSISIYRCVGMFLSMYRYIEGEGACVSQWRDAWWEGMCKATCLSWDLSCTCIELFIWDRRTFFLLVDTKRRQSVV